MNIAKFEVLVAEAVAELPEYFKAQMENVAVIVQDRPMPEQMRQMKIRRDYELLGLYEGVPKTKRGGGYNLVLPDRITIFQKPIEAQCHSEAEIKAAVQEVVRHEIAHHFGSNEETLRRIESKKRKT